MAIVLVNASPSDDVDFRYLLDRLFGGAAALVDLKQSLKRCNYCTRHLINAPTVLTIELDRTVKIRGRWRQQRSSHLIYPKHPCLNNLFRLESRGNLVMQRHVFLRPSYFASIYFFLRCQRTRRRSRGG